MEHVIAELCRYLETHADEAVTLETLAQVSGYSPAHLQKAFRAVTGASPKAYQTALRTGRLRSNLRSGEAVASSIYHAGFGSSSRVYERLAATLGMTPGQYRRGAPEVVIHYASTTTPLGLILIGATERGICFLQFGSSVGELVEVLRSEFPLAQTEPMPETHREEYERWRAALNAELSGRPSLAKLPLDVKGTAFQIAVWQFLQTIPRGEIRSYTEVAQGLGRPSAVRAVASACARNHIALAIPCHRVLRGDGSLGGYKWGLERKQALLRGERQAPWDVAEPVTR